MERISGNKFQQILSDHWEDFYKLNKHRITRNSIPINVNKIISCGNSLGYNSYFCKTCNKVKKVYFSCKSRFCSRCGKKATDQWIIKNSAILPNTKWQHITFTIPDVLWDFFWYNRYLFNHISHISAKVLIQIANSKNIILGIFTAMHTFGRKGNNNVHMHVSTTCGGITKDSKKWLKIYFHEKTVKKIWKTLVVKMFRKYWKKGVLVMPKPLKHIKTNAQFNRWMDAQFNKSWVVHLQKTTQGNGNTLAYLGRYIKRPPIGETRIKKYDGKNVTYQYLDHQTKQKYLSTIPVYTFIALIIAHITTKISRSTGDK